VKITKAQRTGRCDPVLNRGWEARNWLFAPINQRQEALHRPTWQGNGLSRLVYSIPLICKIMAHNGGNLLPRRWCTVGVANWQYQSFMIHD
jgi:hypothetical protein